MDGIRRVVMTLKFLRRVNSHQIETPVSILECPFTIGSLTGLGGGGGGTSIRSGVLLTAVIVEQGRGVVGLKKLIVGGGDFHIVVLGVMLVARSHKDSIVSLNNVGKGLSTGILQDTDNACGMGRKNVPKGIFPIEFRTEDVSTDTAIDKGIKDWKLQDSSSFKLCFILILIKDILIKDFRVDRIGRIHHLREGLVSGCIRKLIVHDCLRVFRYRRHLPKRKVRTGSFIGTAVSFSIR